MSSGRKTPVTGVTGVASASADGVVVPGATLNVENEKVYNPRLFYNSRVVPTKG